MLFNLFNIQLLIITILQLLIITILLLQADRSKTARQEETPEQKRQRLEDKVSKQTSVLLNLFNIQLLIIPYYYYRPIVRRQLGKRKHQSRSEHDWMPR